MNAYDLINDDYLRAVSFGQAELDRTTLEERITDDSYELERQVNELDLGKKAKYYLGEYMLNLFDALDGSKGAINRLIDSLVEIYSYCEEDNTESTRHLIKCLLEKINLI